jgi:CheY-like chemotaxis protein
MSDLRILVIEDKLNWRKKLIRLLAPITGHSETAKDHVRALELIREFHFDLVIVDLGLAGATASNSSEVVAERCSHCGAEYKSGELTSAFSNVEEGLHLLKELRDSTWNGTSALLVVSGQIRTNQVSEAMRKYKVHDFIDKKGFEGKVFLSKVNDALLLARIKSANKRHDRRFRLRIGFDKDRVWGSELQGPKERPFYPVPSTVELDVEEFVRRANNMDVLVDKGPKAWREEASSLGRALYKILSKEPSIVEGLKAAYLDPADLWLQFRGPARGLGVPFELLHDGVDYLAFRHVLTREVESVSGSFKRASFQKFIRSFLGGQVLLRILIVGVDDNDDKPSKYTIQEEAEMLYRVNENELKCLGIRPDIRLLTGKEATSSRIGAELQDGRGGYHIFHYSGHGFRQTDQPELCGIRTADDRLTASDLTTLCRGTELRFVYLSCCLGAYSSPRIEHGDFFGLFDALAKADVPMVMGYRWEVDDPSALALAEVFYKRLWRTLSPGEALLEARNEISRRAAGRDNETWASPVLMTQNT